MIKLSSNQWILVPFNGTFQIPSPRDFLPSLV
uniref:Uncharacterized protein n=1 Tax=Rhizophora mucronata TaxID=61149 RepID=A0A2P2QMQ7_RHIMU